MPRITSFLNHIALSLYQPPYNRSIYNSMSCWYHVKLYITYSNTFFKGRMPYCTSGYPCQSRAWTVILCIEKGNLCILCLGLLLIRLLAYTILSAIRSRLYHQLSGGSVDLLFEALISLWFCLFPFLIYVLHHDHYISFVHLFLFCYYHQQRALIHDVLQCLWNIFSSFPLTVFFSV